MSFSQRSIEFKNYERHRPEESLLYQVVAKNLAPFFKNCEESGHHVPNFIKKEFESFLRCVAVCFPMGLRAYIAKNAIMTAWSHFPAKSEGFVAPVWHAA